MAFAAVSDGVQAAVGSFGSVEYLYGVGSWSVNLIQVDHPNGKVRSALLFPVHQQFYGAAGSNDANYFWATTTGGTTGTGSALYKVYPREKATLQISSDYGQIRDIRVTRIMSFRSKRSLMTTMRMCCMGLITLGCIQLTRRRAGQLHWRFR